jgi:hypothetical protein
MIMSLTKSVLHYSITPILQHSKERLKITHIFAPVPELVHRLRWLASKTYGFA